MLDDPSATSTPSPGRVPPPDDLADLWDQGYGQNRLADHYNTTRHYVRQWLKELGLTTAGRARQGGRRPPGGSSKVPGRQWPPPAAVLRRLYKEHSITEIGDQFGVRRNSVRYWLDQYGIQRRVGVGPQEGTGPLERIPPPPRDELVNLLVTEGRNGEDLARHYQVSTSTFWKWVDGYQIREEFEVPPTAYLTSPTYRTYMTRRREPIPPPPGSPSDQPRRQQK
ncbi:hypothetical protein K1T35_48220 (plasmid) [Pseudonocardia sp. DSM 110487]|uniref:hypothetical protein n=1 Tax=Pseudonocardia sp. DSM 110487 TaxID=2865833 RepID=UPI001C6A6B89|nr:hypothetical protein [Pseudonocardia sp. DSM 110487]QYN41135.1 hypothetical protein K1T35_48220 [Pseudonocardia sp. DSM 110487]